MSNLPARRKAELVTKGAVGGLAVIGILVLVPLVLAIIGVISGVVGFIFSPLGGLVLLGAGGYGLYRWSMSES